MRTSNKVFTTGAHLYPLLVAFENGNKQWRWVVSRFEDDSFGDDGEPVDIYAYADTEEKLFVPEDEG